MKLLEELKRLDLIDFDYIKDKWDAEVTIRITDIPEVCYTEISPFNKQLLNESSVTTNLSFLSIYCLLCIKSRPDYYNKWKNEGGYRFARVSQRKIADYLGTNQAKISNHITKLENIGIINIFRRGYKPSKGKKENNEYYIYSYDENYEIVKKNEVIESVKRRRTNLKNYLKEPAFYPLLLIGEYIDYLDYYLGIKENLKKGHTHGEVNWLDVKQYELVEMDEKNIRNKISYLWNIKNTDKLYIFDLRKKFNSEIQYQLMQFLDLHSSNNPIIVLAEHQNIGSALNSRITSTLKKVESVLERDFKFDNPSKTLRELGFPKNRNYENRIDTIKNGSPKLLSVAGGQNYDKYKRKQDELISELTNGKTYPEI